MCKTVEVYNSRYAENELFKINKEPRYKSGIIIRETNNRGEVREWSAYSLREAIISSIEGALQRRECGDEYSDIETVQDLEWAIGRYLRECEIITFEKFDPDALSQNELQLAEKLNWLIKIDE